MSTDMVPDSYWRWYAENYEGRDEDGNDIPKQP